jgi:hypothetical protein
MKDSKYETSQSLRYFSCYAVDSYRNESAGQSLSKIRGVARRVNAGWI